MEEVKEIASFLLTDLHNHIKWFEDNGEFIDGTPHLFQNGLITLCFIFLGGQRTEVVVGMAIDVIFLNLKF